MYQKSVIFGGRTMRNAGRKHPALLNCFTLGWNDNIESIGSLFRDFSIVSSSGGGVGINASKLREEGSYIYTKGGYACGPLGFMNAVNSIAKTMEQGGQRRAALIGIMDVSHPDILKFINFKKDDKILSSFNISVAINNDFIRAVKNDDMWNLKPFGSAHNIPLTASLPARILWRKIVEQAWKNGEPGIINIENMQRDSYIDAPIYGVNPCGEVPLPENGSCCLASINLENFYYEGGVDLLGLASATKLAVCGLNKVLDKTTYPIDKIRVVSHHYRQVGVGFMGLYNLLARMGIRYGDNERCMTTIDKIMSTILNIAYETSAMLAKTDGPAPSWYNCRDKFFASPIAKKLNTATITHIKQYGLRNMQLLAVAPTGTISIVAETTSGIEPPPAIEWIRKIRYDGSKYKEFHEFASIYKELSGFGLPTDHLVSAYSCPPEEHLAVQKQVQQWTDGSISKTIILPSGYSVDELSDNLLKFLPSLKGVTVYRYGSRKDEPIKVVK